ncbi:hypothetical protein MCOR25_006386 [Pyricularia grisea]|nr:hypothetical protein MCOR25_006386 [Pyricularia grisea]
MTFHAFDVVNVSYLSYLISPTMFTWCSSNGSSIDFSKFQCQADLIWQVCSWFWDLTKYNSMKRMPNRHDQATAGCWLSSSSHISRASHAGSTCNRGSEPEKRVNSEKFTIISEPRPTPTTLGLQEPSGTSTATPRPTTTPAAPSATVADGSASTNQQLSSGAKAGIGVGASLGALLLLSLVFFLGFRFRAGLSETGSQQRIVQELDTTRASKASHSRAHSCMVPEEIVPIREHMDLYSAGMHPDFHLYQQPWRAPGIPELQTVPDVETHKYRG